MKQVEGGKPSEAVVWMVPREDVLDRRRSTLDRAIDKRQALQRKRVQSPSGNGYSALDLDHQTPPPLTDESTG